MAKSIRQRLFAALAGFTVVLCLCYTGLALVIAYVTEDMLVQRLLEREAVAVSQRLRQHGQLTPSGSDLITVYGRYLDLPQAVRRQMPASAPRAEIFTDTGQHYHVLALDLAAAGQPRRAYLLADVAPVLVVQRLVREVGGVVLGVALALVALALLLAYWLARRLVRPLQRLAREARQLAPGGAVHFSGRDRPDEIGFLARRLETTFAELQAVLRREQAFARDVSHELRTPLTLMHNSLALAGALPLAADGQAQLRQGVDDMRATIDVLFALARAEQLPGEVVELRGCLEQCLLRLLDEHRWDASLLALDLPERLAVIGNPQLTMLLINNCLANALFHGGPACRISIAFAQGRLSIVNTVTAGQPRRIHGFAHGQNLLLRLAKAMRWDIVFHPGEAQYRVDILPLQKQ
ncbi:sensor histidine kinase [Janthinobacterium sp. BJB1]|uniref:sensor histidine kinase n=1 Tax=Janthinobacterium sp. GW458P TaxID=1981504 RepID=UPI000A323D26|nr:HAMP domain-containing sensor histidine kinase [Janthinobacterium sp. GW458P]MBE3025592.1 HAMP domain-containing histidine kinase [Janthinobacterium sp. GW458P]PJD00334.1 sensor histidine kinase [Janthinobacterium sp. BJB1]